MNLVKKKSRVCGIWEVLLLLLLFSCFAGGQLRLTEFVADSDGSYPDSDGEPSDWIEICNASHVGHRI